MYFLSFYILLRMIDNSIYDPKKQIWIILELYFESYEFSNFQGIF